MLSLTRKENQSIVLTLNDSVDPSMTVGELFSKGQIEIVISDISKNQVKIGIHAQDEIHILREELASS